MFWSIKHSEDIPEDIHRDFLKDGIAYDLLCAREEETYLSLEELGVIIGSCFDEHERRVLANYLNAYDA